LEIVIYPDTPHAFFADYRPSYRKNKQKTVGNAYRLGSSSMGLVISKRNSPSCRLTFGAQLVHGDLDVPFIENVE